MHLSELTALMKSLVGLPVTAKRMAGSSVCVWFGVLPTEPTARGVWLEPPWRIEGSGGVLTSSHDLPYPENDETEAEYRIRFDQACARSDVLATRYLTDLTVDLTTGDLALLFSEGVVLRSFAMSDDWEDWHYEDHGAGHKHRVLRGQVRSEHSDA